MNIARRISLLFALLFMLVAAGCGGGGGDGTGNGSLALSLTDAAIEDFQGVYVTIQEVQVNLATGDDDEDDDWQVVASPATTFNLLELMNGNLADLGIAELPPGEYAELRMILGDAPDGEMNQFGEAHPFPQYVITEIGEVFELVVPSGFQTGLKLSESFTIDEDFTTELILDFNALKSIVQAGADDIWYLRPTVNVLRNEILATVEGMIQGEFEGEIMPGAEVAAQITDADGDVTVIASTIADESGAFRLLLEPGTYTLIASLDGYETTFIDVVVETGMNIVQDFVLIETVPAGGVEGEIELDTPDAEAFVTLSFQEIVAGGETPFTIEIDSFTLANGGLFNVELPEGEYKVVAYVMIGEARLELITLESVFITGGLVIDLPVLFIGDFPDDDDEMDDDDDMDDEDDPFEKVTLCHNGRTITVAQAAVPAHLAHGDTLGSCEGDIDDDDFDDDGDDSDDMDDDDDSDDDSDDSDDMDDDDDSDDGSDDSDDMDDDDDSDDDSDDSDDMDDDDSDDDSDDSDDMDDDDDSDDGSDDSDDMDDDDDSDDGSDDSDDMDDDDDSDDGSDDSDDMDDDDDSDDDSDDSDDMDDDDDSDDDSDDSDDMDDDDDSDDGSDDSDDMDDDDDDSDDGSDDSDDMDDDDDSDDDSDDSDNSSSEDSNSDDSSSDDSSSDDSSSDDSSSDDSSSDDSSSDDSSSDDSSSDDSSSDDSSSDDSSSDDSSSDDSSSDDSSSDDSSSDDSSSDDSSSDDSSSDDATDDSTDDTEETTT